jgi:hypothetical protein
MSGTKSGCNDVQAQAKRARRKENLGVRHSLQHLPEGGLASSRGLCSSLFYSAGAAH